MTSTTVGRAIPFVDLSLGHEQIRAELDALWNEVVASGVFVGGALVQRFEDDFASYCGTRHCVGVGNGTDALELAVGALGVGPGDEVVVPANTFVASVSAIVRSGATPVFADVDPATLLLTADTLAAALGRKVAAVIVVHLYGQAVDMDSIGAVAARAGIAVVEDAAQAHGATWGGRRVGSFGHAAAFSFYPGKNVGAFGDGGAVVTDDPALAARVRQAANHGRVAGSHVEHDVVGRNSRLDALQAGVLSLKLGRLDEWNDARRDVHAAYVHRLAGSPFALVTISPGGAPVHHLEVVRSTRRDGAVAWLRARDVGCGLHYPTPCHHQAAFARHRRDRLPAVEAAAGEVFSLPMFPMMSDDQVAVVCDELLAFAEGDAHG